MEAQIIKYDSFTREFNKRQGRIIIPHDAPQNHPSGEYRMLPPNPTAFGILPRSSSGLATLSQNLKQFTCFSDLPVEMRLKIWHHTFPGMSDFGSQPRLLCFDCERGPHKLIANHIINIQIGPRVVKVNSYGIVKEQGYNFHAFFSTSKIPIALSICSESRTEALRHYYPSFGMRYPSIPSIIYFNYEIDTLYFEFDSHEALNCQLLIFALSDWYLQVDGRAGMKDVQRVGVSHRIGNRKWEDLFEQLPRFKGLREFIIGAEREDLPVPDDAILEETEENDESLAELRSILTAAREEEWNDMWRELEGTEGHRIGIGIPKWKIMEVRGRVEHEFLPQGDPLDHNFSSSTFFCSRS